MVKQTLWGKQVDIDIAPSLFPTNAEIDAIDSLMLSHGMSHHWFPSTCSSKRNSPPYLLHYRKFVPNGKPKALVVWQHGIMAHSGIGYKLRNGSLTNVALLARELTERGYVLYTLDMLGHGFSEGLRHYVPDWRTNRDDLDSFCRAMIATEYENDIPCFLAGDSYGATTALHVVKKWKDGTTIAPKGFRGFFLTAPAIYGDLPPYPIVFLLRYIMAPLCPTRTPFFMPNPISPERIWSVDEVRELHSLKRTYEMNLEGCGKPFRLGTAVSLLKASEEVRAVSIPGLGVPFCVCHGTSDEGVPISSTDYLVEKSGAKREDYLVKKVQGGFHDLLSEPTSGETVKFIADWIEERIQKTTAFSYVSD